MPVTPMDVNPDGGNDTVTNYQDAKLFEGQPLDVYSWLQIPGNVGDTTQVIINAQTAAPTWAGTMCYATDYLGNFSVIYPDLVVPTS